MDSVFVVQHVHELDEDNEDVKFIGVYRTLIDAENAVERLRVMPGFKLHLDGFDITEYEINKDHWTEGFVTVY